VSVQYQTRFSLPPFMKKVDKVEQTQRKVGMIRDLEAWCMGCVVWEIGRLSGDVNHGLQ